MLCQDGTCNLFSEGITMIVKTIGVVGAGQMGSGIAQVAAAAGFSVMMMDIRDEFLQRGIDAIDASLRRLIKKGALTAGQEQETLSRIATTTDINALAPIDFVIEAASENVDLKLKIFSDLDRVCKPDTILASNTSSISITKIAAATKRPDRVIGMHFMNPVAMMKLVEVITGLATSKETLDTTNTLVTQIGKQALSAKDSPGFLFNRILVPMINEAIYALSEDISTVEEIDEMMKLGGNHPMGPLALADLIGLDTILAIMRVLHEGIGESKYRPCPLLIRYVDAGWLGRKSGKGFYDYANAA
jgi:3-hydroxybutyryl-CoA dehydrogenase